LASTKQQSVKGTLVEALLSKPVLPAVWTGVLYTLPMTILWSFTWHHTKPSIEEMIGFWWEYSHFQAAWPEPTLIKFFRRPFRRSLVSVRIRLFSS